MWPGRQIRHCRESLLCRQFWQQLRGCPSSPPLRLPSLLLSSLPPPPPPPPPPSSFYYEGRPTSVQKKCASHIVGGSSCCHKTLGAYVHSNTAVVPACIPRLRCRRRISTRTKQPTSGGLGQDDRHNRQEEALTEGASEANSKQLEDFQQRGDCIPTLKQFWRRVGSAVKTVFYMCRHDWVNKLGHWKTEAVITLKHYWVGTKLLWMDVRVSSRLLLKLARGKNLSRRERQQLTRTTADMFRLVPFAIFIVVPFMELLLPLFLKVFPNMLPSTFQDKNKEEEAQQRTLNTRMQYAKFLQDTIIEMAKEIKTTRTGDIKRTAEDLDEFMSRLNNWLDLSLNHSVPSSLLILSRALSVSGKLKPEEAVQATLSSLPDEVIESVGISELPSEGILGDRMRKLKFIKSQDEMIKKAEENEEDHKVNAKKKS